MIVLPACVSLCQSIFVYTSYTDQCQSQDNQQLHEESRSSDSRLHDGWLQHFKPCVLGFDTLCSGMFLGALWFSLLGILCPLFLLRKKISSSPQSHSKKTNKNLLCSSRLKPWLKITGPEAELPPNSASFSLPLASFLLLTRSPDTCPLTRTLCFPRQCECNISHLLIHSLHLLSLQIVINTFRVQKWAFIYSPPACFLILGGIKEGSLTTCSFLGAGDAGSHSDKVHCVLHNKHISKSQNKFIWYECVL